MSKAAQRMFLSFGISLIRLGRRDMFEDCGIAKTRSSEEFTDEAIRHYYMYLVKVQNKSAQRAFMVTCEAYGHFYPNTSDWCVPKEVATILNPGLRV